MKYFILGILFVGIIIFLNGIRNIHKINIFKILFNYLRTEEGSFYTDG